jgi:hypothetical protein
MMDFFVLGIIPGTHMQLTFKWVMVALLLAAAIVLLVVDRKRIFAYIKRKKIQTEDTLAYS